LLFVWLTFYFIGLILFSLWFKPDSVKKENFSLSIWCPFCDSSLAERIYYLDYGTVGPFSHFFSLFSFLFFLKLTKTRKKFFLLLSLFSFLFALGSKESASVLPGLILLYLLFFHRKVWFYSLWYFGLFLLYSFWVVKVIKAIPPGVS
jgi:hypothetical protein